MDTKWRGIALLGMPGSGKTTIGGYLANELRCEHVDLDKVITEKQGLDIPTIFRQFGEPYFRKLESETLSSVLGESNKFVILSTGGGTPLYFENLAKIHQAGFLTVFLECSMPTLLDRLSKSIETRPLIQITSLEKDLYTLYHQRLPTYKMALLLTDANGTTEETALEILKTFKH